MALPAREHQRWRRQALLAPPSCRSQHGRERGECGEQGTPSSASPLSREIRVGSHEKGAKKESIFV